MIADKYWYIFFGKVLPERALVSIPGQIAELKVNGKLIGGMTTTVLVSQVTIQINLFEKCSNIYTLKFAIEDGLRVQLDALGYINSCGYDLEITQMIDSSGYVEVFGVNIDDTNKFPQMRPKKFSDIMMLFTTDQGEYLRLCLSDLREAIRTPKDTGFFCYRSIECLRQYFVYANKLDGNDSGIKSWDLLRNELGIERENIDFVKTYADPVRHGGQTIFSGGERMKMFTITWDIIDKFVVYACNGYKKT